MALGPLSLAESSGGGGIFELPKMGQVLGTEGTCCCPCQGCCQTFNLESDDNTVLKHIFNEHKLVIADAEKIALLNKYLQFWKQKFNDNTLDEFCTTMLADTKINGQLCKDQKYYLLSDVLPVDYQLRKDLQKERLERILEHQKLERENKTYERECLFCRTIIKGTRTEFLQHLFEKHNFYIAKLENLIFTADLIELLNCKLENNICIYCEKVFKDRMILKEHMRKKAHKRINPKNKEYDKFFISNYLEMGRNWQSYLKSAESSNSKKKIKNLNSTVDEKSNSSSESDNNWSDWDEKEDLKIVCLFCKHFHNEYIEILNHMEKEHSFNFLKITMDKNFYEKLKIVNYIRRQIFLNKCINCNKEFSNHDSLICHISDEGHFKIDDPKYWNQPEYYFPTYEDDGFLFCLEDNDDTETLETVKSVSPNLKDDKESLHISQEIALSILNS